MLTYNDRTVENAYEIFRQCRNTKAEYWGFKEEGLPIDKMAELYTYMKKQGKTTVLETVAYTEEECLRGAEIAVQCGCDILMGTVYFDSVNHYCKQHGSIKYMPFVGNIENRPSVLSGTAEEMLQDASEYLKKGVFGFDLLGYRHTGNASALIQSFVSQVNAPVCVAGSINSYSKIDEVCRAGAWAFTIGSAFFDHRFGNRFDEQVDKVCQYLETIEKGE